MSAPDPETPPGTAADGADHTDTVALAPNMTGRWNVAGPRTRHLIDLDTWTYERRPGPASSTFPYDARPLRILRIDVWPRVGSRMLLWLEHPDNAFLEQWRLSSTIESITPDNEPPQ